MGRESGHKSAQGVSRLPSHLSLKLLFQVQDLGRTQFLVVAGLKALTLKTLPVPHPLFCPPYGSLLQGQECLCSFKFNFSFLFSRALFKQPT